MTTETRVRAMSKAERRAYLIDHGWYRLSGSGSECWFPPGWRSYGPHRGQVEPGEGGGFYSLAAAIRTAIAQEND